MIKSGIEQSIKENLYIVAGKSAPRVEMSCLSLNFGRPENLCYLLTK
jgi:hypothetical protein